MAPSEYPLRLQSTTDYKAFLDRYDTFMFDCDGVLWHGDHLEPGVVEVLKLLRANNKHVIFVTNNATKSRRNYKTKFDKLGVQAEVDEIFGSAYASAVYISSVLNLPKNEKVFVIGMAGLEEELKEEGINFIGGTDPADLHTNGLDLNAFTPDPAVSVVLCGLDVGVTYAKLAKGFQYLIRNPGCRFIATNEDSTYPAGPGGGLLPGAGSISAPLRYATKTNPIAIGKPNKTMLDCIKAKHNFDPARTVMVGDRLDTDILFGKHGGLGTLLVLSGVTSERDLAATSNPVALPDFFINSLGDISQLNIKS
ncbi:hypothetical protein FRC03_000662 [Tulasnella sp. 419]|nr:hypothetical protein FRC03_000662 [Tulasnella sp. 419]